MTASFLSTVPAGTQKADAQALGAALLDAGAPVDGSYSHEALSAAFAQVQNPEHWKLPIRCAVPAASLDLVKHAVIFFTGGRATTEAVTADRWAIITGRGYYAEVGA